jgi:hypothetical protein
MARTYCLFIIMIFPAVAVAQVRLFASVGYGTYSMQELKKHQQELEMHIPVDAKITTSFPGYWYYQVGAGYHFRSNFFIGCSINYGSTGGKLHYQDYSGEIGWEHKVKYVSVALPFGWRLPFQQNKLNLQFELSPTVYLGNTHLAFERNVNTWVDPQSVEFKSMNFGLQPAIQLERKMGPVMIFTQVGYYIDVYRSNLTVKDNDEYYLLNDHGDEVHADFSGLRATVGVAFALRQ